MQESDVLASRILAWHAQHGRTGLPWQATQDPYKVWLSEIMLQQTQVSTVLQYYPRFLNRLPDVASLAAAPQDEVMALWSGLGYYSRARNLHRCAQHVVQDFGGVFPQSAELLQTLPGIGRSTAAAIAAFCYGERVAILDANVKRVLTRVLGFSDDLAVQRNEKVLWDKATDLLPTKALKTAMPRHTQAMMDLGATLCTARKPACTICPLATTCVARGQGTPEAYPVKTRKLKRSAQSWWLLWAQRADGATWLVQRPGAGVWAGLYCLPMVASEEAIGSLVGAEKISEANALPAFKHVLTHIDLYLHVIKLPWSDNASPSSVGQWVTAASLVDMGLPAPIRKLLTAN